MSAPARSNRTHRSSSSSATRPTTALLAWQSTRRAKLSNAYRKTRKVRKPEGQGLNDLYVRFFRMAERRIAEKTGQGVVCFISNYSWLDGLSFTGMRERLPWRHSTQFESIASTATSTRPARSTPDGKPVIPAFFPPRRTVTGIQVGTAIATASTQVRPRVGKSVAISPSLGPSTSARN